jgi:hypothetical protein
MKKNLILIIGLIGVLTSQAQETKLVKTFYVGESGKRVFNIDSTKYIRTVGLNKNKDNTYEVIDFYTNNTAKSRGNSLTNYYNPKYQGSVVTFYPNGNKASKEEYDNGDLKSGDYYYQNNVLKKIITFDSKKVEQVSVLNDSLGNQFLDQKKSGVFKIIDENGELVEGRYVKGYRDGQWKTFNTKEKETYFDEYKMGQFTHGKTVYENGGVVEYNDLIILPQFEPNPKAFFDFIKTNFDYAACARDNKVEGDIRFSFTIEENGALTNAVLTKRIGSGCDEETLKAIKLSPKWTPGLIRGKPTKMNSQFAVAYQIKTEVKSVSSTSQKSSY